MLDEAVNNLTTFVQYLYERVFLHFAVSKSLFRWYTGGRTFFNSVSDVRTTYYKRTIRNTIKAIKRSFVRAKRRARARKGGSWKLVDNDFLF